MSEHHPERHPLLRALYDPVERFILAFGVLLVGLRDWFAPLSDLRIIALLLLLGSFTILGLEPGLDVVRGMSDEAAFHSSAWYDPRMIGESRQWIAFFLACIWTGVNAWFWPNILYITKRGTAQPRWFTWFRRLLGISPLVCAILAILLVSSGDLGQNWLALLLFGSGIAMLLLAFRWKQDVVERWRRRSAQAARLGEHLPRVGSEGTILKGVYLNRFDRGFVALTVIVALLGLLIFSIPGVRTHAAWCLGSAAIAFGAIGCIIPITSLLIWGTREARIPVIAVGLICFALFSGLNDNHRVRVLTTPHRPAPTLQDALAAWQSRHPDANEPMVLVATSGGASRAAYWTGAVLRNLDEQTGGRFSQSVFAISSVSGGTLGAVGYTAWLADGTKPDMSEKPDDLRRRRLRFMQDFLGADYLSPAVGGMLFPDMIQRFVPFPLFQDRAQSLEESWEMGWDRAVANCGAQCRHESRMRDDFESIWTYVLRRNDTPWIPLVLVNGTLADNGKRIITAPVQITPDIFQDSYDFFDYSYCEQNPQSHCAIRASTAIMNSARFPLVSPAGRLAKGWFQSYGHIIDGGYFENGGLETLVDVLRFVRQKDPTRPILIVEISNNDRAKREDSARDIGEIKPTVLPLEQGWRSPLLAGPKAIIGGLYNTSDARGISSAKRLSTRIPTGAATVDPGLSYYRFRLVPIAKDRHSTMSWALSLSTRDSIDLLFRGAAYDRASMEARVDELIARRPYGTERGEEYRRKLLASLDCETNRFNNFQMLRVRARILMNGENPQWKGARECEQAT